MRLSKQKIPAVVGLDIEAGSIAATEIRRDGSGELTAAAIGELPAGAFHEGEVLDAEALAIALKSFFAKHKLAKQVRLGIGNQGVVVRTLRLPVIENPKEMEAAVRFQAQEAIPMPLDQAVLEHQVVGAVAAEEGSSPQVDVVAVAARREMVASFLDPLRRAGLQPLGIDLSAFAMIRALAGLEAATTEAGLPAESATLYCSLGDVTNLAVARGRACLFTRVSNVGLESIVQRLSAVRGLTAEHANQWMTHVGLDRAVEEIDGDPETVTATREALEEGVVALVDELRLSLDYYGAQEGAIAVERIVLCGPGSVIAGLSERVEGIGFPTTVSRPSVLADLPDESAARLTLPYGLALES